MSVAIRGQTEVTHDKLNATAERNQHISRRPGIPFQQDTCTWLEETPLAFSSGLAHVTLLRCDHVEICVNVQEKYIIHSTVGVAWKRTAPDNQSVICLQTSTSDSIKTSQARNSLPN